MINHPRNPRHRVVAQKSVFVRPPEGFIEPREDDIVIIPANLKKLILGHLRTYHGISTETIYNDLHGFIRNQHIHGGAYTQFYRAFTYKEKGANDKAIQHYSKALNLNPQMAEAYNNRGIAYRDKGDYFHAIEGFNKAIELKPDYAEAYNNRGATYEKTGEIERAIEDYTMAIERKRDYAVAYNNRGVVWLHLHEWEKARMDLTTAKNMGVDITTRFSNTYICVANFEQITGSQLPADIAAMLTPTAG